jgi:hypothetical protein
VSHVAGSRARAMFRSERRRRRSWLAIGIVLLTAGAVAFGWTIRSGTDGRPGQVGRLAAGCVALAGAVVLAAGLGSRRWQDLDRWTRGAIGERVTALRLDELPPRRWAVWHDLRVPGSRANIDHIVVGPTGVWVVDTKTTRSSVRAGRRSVRLGERKLDTGSTRWEADIVAQRVGARLDEELRRRLSVRPIVALHGHGLRRRGGRAGGVRVVPADELVRSVRRGRRRLARSEVRLVCDAIDRAFPSASTS